ncbi:MAG: RNA-binding protein, partial [Deltaproteobacteria bacterium]
MGNKLYIGNLSFNVSEDQLTDHFSAFGNVTSCKIITDRDTGRSKGFAFVEMSTGEEASEAISQLDGQEFEGRNLRVNEAKPQEKRERPQR